MILFIIPVCTYIKSVRKTFNTQLVFTSSTKFISFSRYLCFHLVVSLSHGNWAKLIELEVFVRWTGARAMLFTFLVVYRIAYSMKTEQCCGNLGIFCFLLCLSLTVSLNSLPLCWMNVIPSGIEMNITEEPLRTSRTQHTANPWIYLFRLLQRHRGIPFIKPVYHFRKTY